LTHRRASSALVFITAHQAKESEAANWSKLAGSGATLVIYMPGQNYAAVASLLNAAGVASETPCAIISRATTPHQHTHRSTIAELQRVPNLAAPTLLIVGEVVRFADPATLTNQFAQPATAVGDERSLPALFARSDFGTEESLP
jgi:uroporphyrin-III C-methyltransferase